MRRFVCAPPKDSYPPHIERALMDEHLHAPIVRRDEPEPFRGVEPLHLIFPIIYFFNPSANTLRRLERIDGGSSRRSTRANVMNFPHVIKSTPITPRRRTVNAPRADVTSRRAFRVARSNARPRARRHSTNDRTETIERELDLRTVPRARVDILSAVAGRRVRRRRGGAGSRRGVRTV